MALIGDAAVFLDKDGTLVVDVPYNVDPAYIQPYPETFEVLSRLSGMGYRLVVVSNQPGVAQGYFDEPAVQKAVNALRGLAAQHGVELAGIYYCPHHPDGKISHYARACDCRKPRAGLIQRAIHDLNIDPARSWMIGDILNDIEAGNRAGCQTILVDRGNETEWVQGPFRRPHHVVADLRGALRHIRRPAPEQMASTAGSERR